MALRWRKKDPERGLARICAGPRGSGLYDGDTKYAEVLPKRNWGDGLRYAGWYWVAGWGSGIPHHNSGDTPAPDEATAKAEAMAYVKKHRATQQGDESHG